MEDKVTTAIETEIGKIARPKNVWIVPDMPKTRSGKIMRRPIRSLSFAITTDPALLVVIQALDGITGATLGVLTALVVADLTNGTGRFNLAQGLTGTLSGVGASLSTSISGVAVGKFGDTAGFLGVTVVALAAVAMLWAFMPETKPALVRQRRTPSPSDKSLR